MTFSYIGTQFKASAKIYKDADTTTVIGALEWALRQCQDKLQIREVSPITISSRTDAGVHAIQNTAHVDIDHYDQFRTEYLIKVLNRVYHENKLALRISNVRQVSNEFNARRFVMLRTYLYRLAVAKSDTLRDVPILTDIPISEVQRCYFFGSPCFDADAFKRALAIFPGIHDFTSFTSRPKATLTVRTPIRHIISCYTRQGKPLMNDYEQFCSNYEYWDVIVEGRSFIYNQIRRMVSAAVSAAVGRHSIADLERLLHSPNTDNTLRYRIVPAHGLYLLKVAYNDHDLSIDWKKRVPKEEHLKLVSILDQLRCAGGS